MEDDACCHFGAMGKTGSQGKPQLDTCLMATSHPNQKKKRGAGRLRHNPRSVAVPAATNCGMNWPQVSTFLGDPGCHRLVSSQRAPRSRGLEGEQFGMVSPGSSGLRASRGRCFRADPSVGIAGRHGVPEICRGIGRCRGTHGACAGTGMMPVMFVSERVESGTRLMNR